MINKEHLNVLKQGVELWNKWRVEHPDVSADLRGADLRGATLNRADLRGADLRGANLYRTNLRGADLSGANLSGTTLTDARYDNTTQWPDGFAPPPDAINLDR